MRVLLRKAQPPYKNSDADLLVSPHISMFALLSDREGGDDSMTLHGSAEFESAVKVSRFTEAHVAS